MLHPGKDRAIQLCWAHAELQGAPTWDGLTHVAHELQVRLSGVPAVNDTHIGSAENPDTAEEKPAPKRRAGRSVSHPRRMASSTRVLPLWAGRCSCLQMLCRSRISSRTCDGQPGDNVRDTSTLPGCQGEESSPGKSQ